MLILIVYWILETNHENTFRWALRSYVIGMVGSIVLAIKSGQAIRAVQETRDVRYAATLGQAIDANMLSAMIAVAFLSAIYLFARDRSLFWRAVYFIALLFLPLMMLRTGSRGGLVALAFTLLSPLLFVRQVLRRPALAALLLIVIVAGVGLRGRADPATGTGKLRAAASDGRRPGQGGAGVPHGRHSQRVDAVLVWPMGTGYWSWFERSRQPDLAAQRFLLLAGRLRLSRGRSCSRLFVILLMLTVRRTPLTVEKLYARAVLTFLLVMGLNIKQVSAKYYWVFLAFVLAAERIGWWHAEPEEEWTEDIHHGDTEDTETEV